MLITLNYPVDARLAGSFGWRHARGLRRFSKGVTFEVPYETPIRAAQSGRVVEVDRRGLVIEHAPGLATYYARVGFVLVRRGQYVRGGDVVALAGNLPGLFFAVWLGGRFVDPADAVLLGINSTAAGVVAGGHRPGGEVNWHTLRAELLTWSVLGLAMWAAGD